MGVCVKGTTLVDMEVNSSLMSETVRKVILGLVDLVRIIKAHKITEQIKLKLIGFALPKLSAKGSIVEVEVSYETQHMAFMARIHVIDPLKFPGQLSKAIQNNVKILNICKKYCINEDAKNFVVSLSDEELLVFGNNPKQCVSACAVLCEAENHNVVKCFKKPVLCDSLLQLSTIMTPSDYRIHYEWYNQFKKVIKYHKVKYDPLTYEEAKECLHDLLGKVVLENSVCNV